MYRSEGGPKVVAQHGMDLEPGVREYMGSAMGALEGGDQGDS